MRPISRWSRYMTNTVVVEARTGQTSTGPTYGAAQTYRAHLSRERRLVRTAAGDEVTSEQAVHLMSADPVQPDARVTLSTGDVGSTESHHLRPAIKAVARRFDTRGPHHTVLYL